MKQYVGFVKFLLSVTSLVATAIATPSQAATLAISQGELDFTNFSESFAAIERLNQGNTFAFTNGGFVTVQNIDAQTNFITEPPAASTSALSLAFGESKDYFGYSETEAKIIGNFDVEAGRSFYFNFIAALNLETSIDESPAENAGATGDISFLLFNTTDIQEQNSDFISILLANKTNNFAKNPLDFFSLTGNLDTLGNKDFITYQKSANVTLFSEDSQVNFGDNQEFATAFISGSLQRYFANQANLTLVALRKSQVRVTAPEPSMSLALLFMGGLFVGVRRRETGDRSQESGDKKVKSFT
ncbi:PEP-CTERM sorting domain-containing protein [Iningainema tapete]|uniref:PEP-CTERM sorting domain-containing protein n=1 Tax=Iningainema tapete BLCC-T55 TaxID=2748662 RepID=A0A8J6XIX1_9CYAN|nr:PEP-CTERM sorting domain-containing protein [Iningainema tapete]MBD2776829.1 PEP-CTERM sorting domain-containing protein [Iningainema tapete BLCC-T55]